MGTTKELARVGEVAERLGVSPRTIKYYEELGLIVPEGRSAGGFRLYGEDDIRRLERIVKMKGMGFSLAAIREILSVRDTAKEATRVAVLSEAEKHLEQRRQEVEARIRELRNDLKSAEALHRELGQDIALCKKRIEELTREP